VRSSSTQSIVSLALVVVAQISSIMATRSVCGVPRQFCVM
jgi:hypothetical protein